MRIALDYTAAIRQGAGIGQYVRSLVHAMLEQDAHNRYTLLTSGRATNEHPFPCAENVRGRNLMLSDRYLNILWYRWHVPILANYVTGPVDIYHGLDFVLPPLSKKIRKVVTIHDLAFLEHPETAFPTVAVYLNKVVPEAVTRADVVVAVSQTTKQSLITHYHTPAEKIVVIPCGVGPQFQRVTDSVILEGIRSKFALQQPFIFCVGTLQPRKNHLGLIRAFHEMQQNKPNPLILVIAGDKGWMYEETQNLVKELKLEEKVRFLGRIGEHELIVLYSLAEMFAYPSFIEGFGIPPLEAMACGVPVITSNTSSLPEVAGDAALLVDPHDVHSIADALRRVAEDTQLREDLRQRGYRQAQRYTWSGAAAKMLAVYQRISQGITTMRDEVLVGTFSES
ncbi:MAG: glycosyltransferase family 4 protein [Ktedonobacteraceae bacterium]